MKKLFGALKGLTLGGGNAAKKESCCNIEIKEVDSENAKDVGSHACCEEK